MNEFGGKSMIGIYRTFNMTANIICFTQLLFTKTNVFIDYKLLECYCDLRINIFGINNNNVKTKNALINVNIIF